MTLLLSIALIALGGSCSSSPAPPAGIEGAIPLNLDFERPGLVDERLPWGWSFQAMAGAGVGVDRATDSSGLRFRRTPERAADGDARAVYDLNRSFAGQRLSLAARVRCDDASPASLRIGLLVLDHDWELTEAFSPWRECGDLEVELPVPVDSWNAQIAAEYRGQGDAILGRLHLAVDGVEAGSVLPGQTPPDPLLVDWLRDHAVALRSTDPNAPLDDLDALAPLVGETPLVLLGESTHGSAQFFDLKTRLVKWLASRGAPLVFVLEDHPDKAERVDRFIQTGEGTAASAVEGLFGFWRRQEMVDLVQWLRDARAKGEVRVEFAGIDLQVPLGAMARLEVAARALGPEVARRVESSLAPMRRAWEEGWYPRRDPDEYRRWEASAREVGRLLEAAGAGERTLFDARLVRQSAAVSGADSIRLRDRYLAENLAWLREHSAPGSRFVVWAHNTHVRLDEDAMGQWLEERFPGEVLSVGLFTDRGAYIAYDGAELRAYSLFPGPPESLERALHLTGRELFAVDLRPLRKPEAPRVLATALYHRNIGLWPMDFGFYRVVIPSGFHAILYVDETTPTRPIEDP